MADAPQRRVSAPIGRHSRRDEAIQCGIPLSLLVGLGISRGAYMGYGAVGR